VYTGTVKLNAEQQRENEKSLAGVGEWLKTVQQLSSQINGNFESLHYEHLNFYNKLVAGMPKHMAQALFDTLHRIGQF